ncbi:MAG TPA: phasin family protein [Stellaceae bacterium]|jgi:hypothetical protein
MPDDKRKPSPAAEPTAAFDGVFDFNRNAFGSWARNMSKLSQEMAQFMQARLKQEAAMWEKLASCHDAAEVIQCQGEFASKTGTDYVDAAQKLSRLMLDFASSYSFDGGKRPPETD